jgi:hypothetical protein
MNKTALFVEGQTELIFVRNLLLTVFEPERLIIQCFHLFNENHPEPTDYSHQGSKPDLFFLINNIGNDQKVLSTLLKRQKQLIERGGFERIIGLRDMYGKAYSDLSENQIVSKELNRRFIQSHNDQIKYWTDQPEKIHFCFAIMEVEAWFLGFDQLHQRLSKRFDGNLVKEKLGFRLTKINPETAFFHPTAVLEELFKILGLKYNKSAKTIDQISKALQKQDIHRMLESNKCPSFRYFYQALTWEGYLL